MAQSLKLRDYQGRSIRTLLLDLKVYEFLQVKVIEEAIKSLYLGKVNFGGSFFRQSSAHKTLFITNFSDKLDFEAMDRGSMLSCTRRYGTSNDNAHPLSYHAVFSRMYTLYLTEICVFALVLVCFQLFDLVCINIYYEIEPQVLKMRAAFAANEMMSPLTPEENKLVVDTMKLLHLYVNLTFDC